MVEELNTSTTSMKRVDPEVAAWLNRFTDLQSEEISIDESLQEDHEAVLDGSKLQPRLPWLSRSNHVADMVTSYDMGLIYERPWLTRLWTMQEVDLA